MPVENELPILFVNGMRLLHTADWHLNDRLGRIDRTADLRAAVERVAAVAEAEAADVLLVAGDLFSELARPDGLRETIQHLQKTFRGFLDRGGTILAVTGNHDSDTFCQTLRHAMSLAAGDIDEPGDALPPGRLFLATRPTLLTLAGVPFALMPWPTVTQYPEAVEPAATPIEKSNRLARAFGEALRDLPVHAGKPAVLVAHIQASGTALGEAAFRIDERDNVVVDTAAAAARFAYVALGHVHKPQAVGGHAHVRYAGSIERMDLGEQFDAKSCVVVDLDATGLAAPPRVVPLEATKVYPVLVTDPEADLPRLAAEHADAARDLVNVTIRYRPEAHRLETILTDLAKLFPRWYVRHWDDASQVAPAVDSGQAERGKAFAETVRDYVAVQAALLAEVDREATGRRLEDLLHEEPA
jgi:exonuclease SbcD